MWLLRTGAHRHPCELPILTSQESVHNHRVRKGLEEICTFPGTRELARVAMTESMTIAERLGIKFGVTFEQRIDAAQKVGADKPSMLQEIETRRPTEADAVVGCRGRAGADRRRAAAGDGHGLSRGQVVGESGARRPGRAARHSATRGKTPRASVLSAARALGAMRALKARQRGFSASNASNAAMISKADAT